VRFVRKRSPRTKIIVGGPFVNSLTHEQDKETQDYVLANIGADIYTTGFHGMPALGALAAALRDLRSASSQTSPTSSSRIRR
jgi:hypothetical protein